MFCRGGSLPCVCADARYIDAVIVSQATIAAALAWRASFMPFELDGPAGADAAAPGANAGSPPAADTAAAASDTASLKFKCVGARGGDGHDFSSDELKRAVAVGLSALGMQARRNQLYCFHRESAREH